MLKKGVSDQKQKKWTSSLNSAYSNYFRYQISAKTDSFNFLDQICPKRLFPIKNRKSNQTSPSNSAYSNWSSYQILAETDNFDFLDQICPKRVFPVENEKSEQHHWVLHIGIKLSAKIIGAMALLSQSREGWPSMALLGHVENSQTKMLWNF